jgi:hypothetical protein
VRRTDGLKRFLRRFVDFAGNVDSKLGEFLGARQVVLDQVGGKPRNRIAERFRLALSGRFVESFIV